jgi:flagellar hook-associated protein 3 FlgL
MRVTESRMTQQAADAVSKQREKAAEAGNELTTGVRVGKPSDDLAAWAEGARSRARQVMSEARGNAIGTSKDRLSATENALDGVNGVLVSARDLAIQMSNGSYDAQARADAVTQVQSLRAQALALANTQGPDGTYVLAGAASTTPPFDASGTYVGDNQRVVVESGESHRSVGNVPGSVLTAANGGVDIFATLDALATALGANDLTGIRNSLTPLTSGIAQLASARTDLGDRMSALNDADDARQSFELELAAQTEHAIGADPVQAASRLAQTQQAFEAARTVAQQIIAMFRRA